MYRKAVEFAKAAQVICNGLPKEGTKPVIDQLRRASQSIPLNIAEGCSRYSERDKTNFWRIAKGSVFECAAIVDLLSELNLADHSVADSLQADLAQIGKMLSGLIRWIEKNPREVKG